VLLTPKAGHRSGYSHQEFGLRARRFALHLGDAAKDEQRNALDWHAEEACDE
jgi:hypothetical protein